MRYDRRDFLKQIAVAGTTLTVAGPVSAGGGSRYIVVGSGSGVRDNIVDAGFSVQHELGGNVFLVIADDRTALESVSGVSEVAADQQLELNAPEREEDTTDEDLYPLQWDKQVTDVSEAHTQATGQGTRLAIIDTGVDFDHPDLAENTNESLSKLFKFGDVTDDTQDVYGHGTHVAGIAAASNEGMQGVAGTAPDAEIVSLRVFYYVDGGLYTTRGDILKAIDYAAEIGADAANMSLGTSPIPPEYNAGGLRTGYERVIQSATRRGTLVVASAGNSGANLQQGGYFTLPNSVAGAMSISATGPNDKRVFYSNYGTDEIDVGAPGGGYETLEKTLASDTEWPYPTNLVVSSVPPEIYGAYYAYFAGTSMAAPQVTGVAALVRETDPSTTAKQIESAIKHGADGVAGQSDADLGAGRLNAKGALDSL
ncbi:S8 family peptidase [Haladaptatus sp. NG-SE-30]